MMPSAHALIVTALLLSTTGQLPPPNLLANGDARVGALAALLVAA